MKSPVKDVRVGIVGYGFVGRHLHELFRPVSEIVIYDKYLFLGSQHEINTCNLVFLAVPTPALPSGACDLTEVNEAVGWVAPPICLKSTVPPGTTQRLQVNSGKSIIFSPEYSGETPFHRYAKSLDYDLVVLGGGRAAIGPFLELHKRALGPQPKYFLTDSTTAELAKYMENCFFATKVALVAQFFLIATSLNIDFDQLREIWVADERVGRSHSIALDELGFGGRCLPKDLSAIVALCNDAGIDCSLLQSVAEFNLRTRHLDKKYEQSSDQQSAAPALINLGRV